MNYQSVGMCRGCANSLEGQKDYASVSDTVDIQGDIFSYTQIFLILSGHVIQNSEPLHFCVCCADSLIGFMQFRAQCQQMTAWFNGKKTGVPVKIKEEEEVEEVQQTKHPVIVEILPDDRVEKEEEVIEEIVAEGMSDDDMEFLDEERDEVIVTSAVANQAVGDPLLCSLCGDNFFDRDEFVDHLREMHPLDAPDSKSFSYCGKNEIIIESPPSLSVRRVGRPPKTAYRVVQQRSTEVVQPQQQQGVANVYFCDFCGKPSTDKTALRFHMNVHTKPNQCDMCDAAFSGHTKLKIHKEQIHGLGEILQCPQCDYQTRTRIYLTKHITMTHERKRTKRHSCAECGLLFYSPKDLEDHMHRHSDVKSFFCSKCTASFKTKKSLGAHQRVHNDYKYECPVCNRTFLTNQQLRTHVSRTHPEFELPPPGTIMRKDYQPPWMKALLRAEFE